MAEFRGFTCDQCGAIHPSAERTVYTQRFEGLGIDGERSFDYCPECIQKLDLSDLKPIRRRAKPGEQDPSV